MQETNQKFTSYEAFNFFGDLPLILKFGSYCTTRRKLATTVIPKNITGDPIGIISPHLVSHHAKGTGLNFSKDPLI